LNKANFDISLFKETAEEINVAAGKLPELISKADAISMKITARAAFLIILIFASFFAYRWFFAKYGKS
jgi:hypothetical protein